MFRLFSDIKVKEDEILLYCKIRKDKSKGIFGLFSNGSEIAQKNLDSFFAGEDFPSHDTHIVKLPLNTFIGRIDEELCLHIDELKEYLNSDV